MRLGMKLPWALSIALSAVGFLAASGALSPVAADPALVWGYDDASGDQRAEVDVIRTELDINVQGYYRVRVYGEDFVKNKTDLVGIWFDSDKDAGRPNYYVVWYLGKNPTPRQVGHMHLKRMHSWFSGPVPNVRCSGMRHQVNYAKDVITVMVPRRCLGYPGEVRWAGQLYWIKRWEDTDPDAPGISVYGPHDYFPTLRAWSPWVA